MSLSELNFYKYLRRNDMADDEKKGFFKKIGDALSNKDELAAQEAAKKEAAEAELKAKTEKMRQEAMERSAERAKKEAEDAAAKAKLEAEQVKQKAMDDLEAKRLEFQKKQDAAELQELRATEAKRKAEEAEKAKYIKHVWTNEDTYASLAFEHYGSIQEPYWRLIYNHNKAIIGDHPNHIRTGLEIEIPPLPDELKKKP
jgi:nucleoid-associated protein YgaU